MIYYKVEQQDTNCPVYQLTINSITRHVRNSSMVYYCKTTSCCVKLKAVHNKCAFMFSSKIDSIYKFDMSTYEGGKYTYYA